MQSPVVDVPGVVRVLERAEGLLEVGLGRGQAAENDDCILHAQVPLENENDGQDSPRHHHCPCVPPERVLQQPGQLGLPVGDVAGLLLAQGL